MKSFHPNPTSPQEHRENWRVTNAVLDELYFKHVMVPGVGGLDSGVSFVSNVVPGVASVQFNKGGAIEAWRQELVRRDRWQKSQVRVTITYTATAGSTNNFHMALITREHKAGDVHSVGSLLASAFVIPGPAVANTEMSYVFTSSTTAIAGAKPNLSFVVVRDPTQADDTNANALHIFNVLWEVMPL